MPSLKRKILRKPKIVHKGLAIVLLPLLLNLSLVFVLDNALARAAHWMERSRQNCQLITGLAECLCTTSAIVSMGGNAMMNGSYDIFGKTIEELLSKLELFLVNLEPHAPAELNFALLRTQTKALVAHQRAIFSISKEPVSADEGLIVKLHRAKDWTKTGGMESTLLQKVLYQGEDLLQDATKMEQQSQLMAKSIVGIGLAFNFCLALLLAYFFHKNISNRVKVLVRNARKLPKYEEITERVRGYDELADLGHALHAASINVIDALEYRRSLMQMMAHDLRSPLAAGLVSIEIIEQFKQEGLSQADKNELVQVREGLESCLGLIGDLLLLESLETGKIALDLQLENLSELIDATISELSEYVQARGVEIRNQVGHQYVEADRIYVMVVLKKLLLQAVKDCRLGQSVNVSGQSGDHSFCVSISAPGTSIDPALKDNLFDSLFQVGAGADGEQGVARLGFTICKQIVTAHRGQIDVDCRAGNGTVFWFDLPTEAGAPPSGAR